MHYDLATVNEVIADAVPERDAIVFRDRRITYGELTKRTRQLANYLAAEGFGHHTERADLDDWQSGQDHLGIYLYNGNEYLEAMLGAFKARVAPFNVNYRYRRRGARLSAERRPRPRAGVPQFAGRSRCRYSRSGAEP